MCSSRPFSFPRFISNEDAVHDAEPFCRREEGIPHADDAAGGNGEVEICGSAVNFHVAHDTEPFSEHLDNRARKFFRGFDGDKLHRFRFLPAYFFYDDLRPRWFKLNSFPPLFFEEYRGGQFAASRYNPPVSSFRGYDVERD